MRALIVLLVLLASLASARETIVSGDSDHVFLPSGDIAEDHAKETMLFRATLRNKAGTSEQWLGFWTSSFSTSLCAPLQGNLNNEIYEIPGSCTFPTNSWSPPREVTITRIGVLLSTPWFYNPVTYSFSDCNFRFVAVNPDLSVVELMTERQWPADRNDADGYIQTAIDVLPSQKIGLQLRSTSNLCAVEHPSGGALYFGYLGEIQIWGVYK